MDPVSAGAQYRCCQLQSLLCPQPPQPPLLLLLQARLAASALPSRPHCPGVGCCRCWKRTSQVTRLQMKWPGPQVTDRPVLQPQRTSCMCQQLHSTCASKHWRKCRWHTARDPGLRGPMVLVLLLTHIWGLMLHSQAGRMQRCCRRCRRVYAPAAPPSAVACLSEMLLLVCQSPDLLQQDTCTQQPPDPVDCKLVGFRLQPLSLATAQHQ